MQRPSDNKSCNILESIGVCLRKCLFSVLSFGPMPNHIAFIMDGNRRFANSRNIKQGSGHRVGFSALLSVLRYCYEMGVKYVTVYAFSIDNFKRKPEEVQSVMDLLQEKIEELLREESIVYEYGIRINFWGDMSLLSEQVRLSIQKVTNATASNSGPVLSVCVAYTSTSEIVHAIEEANRDRIQSTCSASCNGDYSGGVCVEDLISVDDLERHFYTVDCPEPDILIRTSGETRLSNFLLSQTTFTHLQNPIVLWPEFSLRHLVWAVLEFQRVHPYLKEIRKQSIKRC